MAAVLAHPAGAAAPAPGGMPGSPAGGAAAAQEELPLGQPPHMIRGQLGGFSQMCLAGQAFRQCTACSPVVVREYRRRGADFILEVRARRRGRGPQGSRARGRLPGRLAACSCLLCWLKRVQALVALLSRVGRGWGAPISWGALRSSAAACQLVLGFVHKSSCSLPAVSNPCSLSARCVQGLAAPRFASLPGQLCTVHPTCPL